MPRRPRSREDDAAFVGMGKAIVHLREHRGIDREELAEKIEEDPSGDRYLPKPTKLQGAGKGASDYVAEGAALSLYLAVPPSSGCAPREAAKHHGFRLVPQQL